MLQRPYKILVVDDEPDIQPLFMQRMRRDIRSGRYELLFAGNGVEAMERLISERDIDMVVTDINMPEMDGLTLLNQIPSVDPNIRSVIISAYPQSTEDMSVAVCLVLPCSIMVCETANRPEARSTQQMLPLDHPDRRSPSTTAVWWPMLGCSFRSRWPRPGSA